MHKALQQKLSEPVQLPSIAKDIHVLMQALADDKLNYLRLAEIIKHYPEITARILFLANSPWSAPVASINNIELACSRLGVPTVKSISIAISVSSSFETRRCPLFDTVHFWTSSMLVADGAKILASKLPPSLVSVELEHTAQTAGILHNLGLLWLADNAPTEINTALKMLAEDHPPLSLNQALKKSIAVDYCEVGAWIAKQLAFPEVLICALEYHLTPDYQDSSWEIALIIGAAANMVSELQQHSKEIASNSRLEALGVDFDTQQLVFQQLSKNFKKTQQLAKTLFKG